MAGIDDVLERLLTDDAFRARLATDPDAALAGYDLTEADRALLASQVSSDTGRAGAVEGRASKAGLFGLLGGLDEIADAMSAGAEDSAVPNAAEAGTSPGPNGSPPYNPYVTVDHIEAMPADTGDAVGYDYPGDYAGRFDGVPPAADATGSAPQQAPTPGGVQHQDDWGSEDTTGADHEAAHVVQQGAGAADGEDATEGPSLAGGTDAAYDPWPSKVEWGGFDTESDDGERPALEELTGTPEAAAPAGASDLSADAGPAPPTSYGDAGEQVYLAVKLENVHGPSAGSTDVVAPTSDPAAEQPNESNLDFVQQRADAEVGTDLTVEKVEIVHESIGRVPAGQGTDPAPMPSDVMLDPTADSDQGTWIELNSVSQTVTEAARPELSDLETASAPGGAASGEDSPGLWQVNADAGPTPGQGVNEVSMDDSAGRETGEHEIEMSVEPGETPPTTEPDQVATPQQDDTPTHSPDA